MQHVNTAIPISLKEIHLWVVSPYEIQDELVQSRYRELLTGKQIERMERFLMRRDRLNYLVSRALTRWVLSRYTGVAPNAWRFKTNIYGRPELEGPDTPLDLKFNLSHTDGLILFAVTLENEIGVDVESLERPGIDDGLISRVFAPGEVRHLQALSGQGKKRRFTEFWTLKESYIKAKGMGLSIPLSSFCFNLDGNSGLTISFEKEREERPDNWRFWLIEPAKHYRAALALRCPPGNTKILTAFNAVPFRQFTPLDFGLIRTSDPR